MVVKAGIEPAHPNGRKILNLVCLPIPPLNHMEKNNKYTYGKLSISVYLIDSDYNSSKIFITAIKFNIL